MRKGLFAAVVIAGLALSGTFALKAKAAGDYLPVGSKAPDFSAISQEDKAVHLSDYKGKWVVLYFYPKDQTTGCTIEAHNFQRDIKKYEAAKGSAFTLEEFHNRALDQGPLPLEYLEKIILPEHTQK